MLQEEHLNVIVKLIDIEYLKEHKKLSEDEAREIFIQILDTVSYCHSKGITHRDLKLENIVFSDKSKTIIKIIDFGVSGLFKGERSKAGSIQYMAPEVVSGSNTASSPQIDIWSIGCMLYELISGEPLFQGEVDVMKVFMILFYLFRRKL
jgi:serine/threonine protein kinase